MAKEIISLLLFSLFSSLGIFILPAAGSTKATSPPPPLFVIGDSTADVGTNTFLAGSKARADFPFYGIDFPNSRPTGRFSNGFNSADYLAQLMGHKKSPPPFLLLLTLQSGFQKRLFKGVNFASGGAGLLDLTGKALKVVPMSDQIKQFATVQSNLTALVGAPATETMLSKSIFCISIGSNDLLGYFLINNTIPKEVYISLLMNTYEAYIKNLYSLGARKFGIISVPPIGCVPAVRLLNATGGCLESINEVARLFHRSLDSLLCRLSSELPEMKYSLGNSYEMAINVILNPRPFNFKNVVKACCGKGKLNAQLPCNRKASLCPRRKEYLFWDMFHPTQAAAELAADTLYGGGPRFVSPINFSQLAEDC